MTFDLKAQLMVDLGNWQAGLTKASKQMTGFGKSMKTISNGVKAGFAGLALVGIASIYDGIVDMTKAASQDAKSVALLNKQMDNSWKATSKTKKVMSAYLDTVSNATGILDDNLRPAFAKIVRVVKGPTKAIKAFDMALNISAGTGKDLNVVTAAYAKYLGGNKTALEKLVPGLKTAADAAGFLNGQFAGMSEVAGKNDPFARINAIMDNFKEKLGAAFLPLVNSFADWLAGPDSQAAMDKVAQWVTDTFAWFQSPEGQAAIKEWYDRIKTLIIKASELIDKIIELSDNPIVKFLFATDAAKVEDVIANAPMFNAERNKFNGVPGLNPNLVVQNANRPEGNPGPVTNYYTINGVVSGNDVLKALRGQATQKGRTILGLLSQ